MLKNTLVLLMVFLSSIGRASEIRLDVRTEIVLEGDIEKGDYDKLVEIAKKYSVFPGRMYLASPGDNLAEAIKIGRLIRRLRWSTEVPVTLEVSSSPVVVKGLAEMHGIKNQARNNVCASACFFIFIAGIYRYGDTLGLHRPYLSDADLRQLTGNQAMQASQGVRVVVDTYLKEMGLPVKYSEIMQSVPRDQVRWLEYEEVRVDLRGFIPELRDWMNAKCDKTTPAERVARENLKNKPAEKWTSDEEQVSKALVKRDLEMFRCWSDVQIEMRREGWRNVFGQK
jgi:hypothetical protein